MAVVDIFNFSSFSLSFLNQGERGQEERSERSSRETEGIPGTGEVGAWISLSRFLFLPAQISFLWGRLLVNACGEV